MNKHSLYGIIIMIVAMQVVTINDVAAKWLIRDYSAIQIGWMRFVFQMLTLLPLVLLRHRSEFRREIVRPTHILRGALWGLSVMAFFTAIATNPIPDTLAFSFVAPLVVVALAGLLLGERFDWKRTLAVVVGLGGILIVLRPGGGVYDGTILFGLVGGVAYGGYLMATRGTVLRLSPIGTTFFAALWATVLTAPLMIFFWHTPDGEGLAIMVFIGVVTAVGHYLIALAARFASASTIAPFNYTEIVGATVVSAVVFGTFPDTWVFVGLGVVAISGLYVLANSAYKPAQ